MTVARIMLYGDLHLSSEDHGFHIDYANETIHYLKEITKMAAECGATHLIGLGDFAFGRFKSLEYRVEVEEELVKQKRLTNGNRYELKGNHDSASYGMTEYEYYVKKKLLLPSRNLEIGNVRISMIDSGMAEKTEILEPDERYTNVVLAHDYMVFSDTNMPKMGRKVINLDTFTRWFGVDYIIGGHIHMPYIFKGRMWKGEEHKIVCVQYPGSMSRPEYLKGKMDYNTIPIVILTIDDEDKMKYSVIDMDLLPLEETFNITLIEREVEEQKAKKERLNISDVIQAANNYDGGIGDVVQIIESMEDIDGKYRDKAIELYKSSET